VNAALTNITGFNRCFLLPSPSLKICRNPLHACLSAYRAQAGILWFRFSFFKYLK